MSNIRQRVLITGGSGLLAMNWALLVRNRCDVTLLTHHHKMAMDGVRSVSADLGSVESVRKVFQVYSPDVVVHTAGFTDVDGCEKDPDRSHVSNVVLARDVAQVTFEVGAKLVHISTDHLFDGLRANLTEDEEPRPVNVYGKSKGQAEVMVMDQCSNALLVRTNFYGWGHSNRRSFSDWVIASLERKQQIKVFDDVYYTPIFIDDLVDAIDQLLSVGAVGVVNVVSDQRLSKYAFALAVADEFGLKRSLVVKSSIEDVALFAPRPRDMSLDNSKAVALIGRNLGSVSEGLHRLHLGVDRKTVLGRCFQGEE